MNLPSQAFRNHSSAKPFKYGFEVPPIVLSNWKTYLLNLARKALPSHTPEDVDVIYQVFDALRETNEASPTPRDLKLYINQIGALHRQWQHAFPLAILAYYVLLRKKEPDIRAKLSEENFPPSAILPIIQQSSVTEIKKCLAGFWFNVPVRRPANDTV